MKKFTSILLAVIMVIGVFFAVPITANAYDYYYDTVTSGDYVYRVLPDGTAEITGYVGYKQEIEIPPIIDNYLVTSIGDEAFTYNLNPPPLMSSIAQTRASKYVRLYKVVIPITVKNIGNRAFCLCNYLSEIVIPSSVTSIGDDAFYGTPWLESQPDGCVYINDVLYCYKGDMPENTDIVVRNGTVQISSHAFMDYKNLSSIIIPDSVTSIGSFAFYGCTGLTDAPLPPSLTSLGEYAFYDCVGITEIELPPSLTVLESSVFEGCEGITEVVIPDTVTYIKASVFRYCKNLSSITIPSTDIRILNGTFDGTPWYKKQPDGYIYINNMLYDYKGTVPENTVVEIREGTTEICAQVFENQKNIIGVKIPDSVSIINVEAFRYCDNLKYVVVRDTVKSLGLYAFSQGITMYGMAGSAAEEYSKTPRFEVNFILIGDVDDDGNISITDATEIQRIVALLYQMNDFNVVDYDGDGVVSVLDATSIQLKLAKA